MAAIDAAARHVDMDRVFVAGGSHGGFLACHLVLRDARVRAAAMRNPVTNVAASTPPPPPRPRPPAARALRCDI